jgi:hypothetical protein
MPEQFPKNDFGNTITVTCQEDGVAVDLTQYTITTKTITLWPPRGAESEIAASYGSPPGDGSDGVLSITVPESTFILADKRWKVYATIAGTGFQYSTIPTQFEVVDNRA